MTTQGSMTGVSTALPVAIEERFDEILAQWQAAVNRKHADSGFANHPADQVHGHFGAKYARLDIGGSGAFMVEIAKDGVLWDIDGVRYHQNASVPRTPGKHWIE